MVRVIIKGGVWKNTEDEILKAAISKYGLNQWARISSLLVRKTPKQCKARWYEWLDPSIKKTEWSKEEDEKLLHLAKLMPTQWRTIAPIVGRTANQCLERYQRLLDEAEAQDNQAGSSSLALTGTGEAVPSADQVRRLRPGEIDPDPETKPARPDPIDMDEDEKEMLSEARARLANTQGKKAKRKARERALEEARRLATLQKRRELKAAGIVMRQKPKKDGMDYNADIPFEKKPALGFYDTSAEASKSYQAPVGKTLKALESRGADENEHQKRKRQREAEEKTKQAKQTASIRNEEQIRKLKEAEQISKRRKLNLPDAQVGQAELDEIVKLGQADQHARSLVEDTGSQATGGLLDEYSNVLESAKHARTPQVASNEDRVMREARNLRLISSSQTPLLGDANVDLRDASSQHSPVQMYTLAQQTPNPLVTPARSLGSASDLANASSSHAGATPLRTPLRDNLGINSYEEGSLASGTPKMLKNARNAAQQQLRLGLSSLPAPKNDFEIVVDAEQEGHQVEATFDAEAAVEEDAAARDARIAQQHEQEVQAQLARRSQVVKRRLPRPAIVDWQTLLDVVDKNSSSGLRDPVQKMVARELVALLHHDAETYPVPGSKPEHFGSTRLDHPSDGALSEARRLMHAELADRVGFPGASDQAVERLIGAAVQDDEPALSGLQNNLVDRWQRYHNDVGTLSLLLKSSRSKMAERALLAAKGEKMLGKLLGGYQARARALSQSIRDQATSLEESEISQMTFERLYREEQVSIAERLRSLKGEVEVLESRENLAQRRFRQLENDKKQLQEDCEMLQMQIDMRRAESLNEAALAQ
ncbi:hypothetical protein BCV70DRAFT_103917 [Testicularia cyperi]|uniref:Pre-mRNA-splicing factor CEF1 n=1 Tax=Testicularia cyperi TaxID=1882483 RepID=A0A317XQC5_9BASI|nr:hypothetical protein BCV70DRAFT_103917 [Testicularia cyperi]